MRLIDAEALQESFHKKFDKEELQYTQPFILASLNLLGKFIDNAPTIEVKPVVHAHWKNWGCAGTVCSNCYGRVLYECDEQEKKSKYCPHCGAQMDEEVTETKGE